jgi:nudix-type nucleoside diphosphatase (YffH/AdpP family)
VLHDGWSRFLRVKVRLEDGAEVDRQVEDHGNAVAVLAYDPDRRTALLVRQLRMGPLVAGETDPYLLEVPAGIIEDEPPETAARREALEEIGVRLGALEPCGAPFSTAGVSTERIHLFLGAFSAADRVEAGGGLEGEHENIRVVERPLAELLAQVLAGEIRDLKTATLTLALHARRPGLFAPG